MTLPFISKTPRSRILAAFAGLGLLTFLTTMNAETAAQASEAKSSTPSATQKATFGGGCFWCMEAVFERLDGVKAVVSGYAGGKTDHPTYKQVCTGTTGHAEVIQIEYDPKKISYESLLDMFWHAHDPTTKDRQGADVGTQYRSVIFYQTEEEKAAAEKSKKAVADEFDNPIVTEISPLTKFFAAEDYHQDYFRNNPNAPYCAVVIQPKLYKLQKKGKLR